MGSRRKGRELAVQVLYQMELQGDASAVALTLFFDRADAGSRAKSFAAELTDGVGAHRARIDELIGAAIEHWRFDRLSPVDVNVLRVATFELLHQAVPTSVVLDEAIEIARRFGSGESAVFVNGVLDHIAGELGVKPARIDRGAIDDG